MEFFRQSWFKIILIIFLVLSIGTSYVRFMVLHDYIVAYEGACDEYTQSCFIGCEDDACTSNYYYSKVQKYEPNLFAQCGNDITDCEDANICLTQNDEKCSIIYCNPELDGENCEILTEADLSEKETSTDGAMTATDEAIINEVSTTSDDTTQEQGIENNNDLINI